MIKVSKIINTRGLKGECKMFLYTDDPNHRFQKGRILYLDQKEPMEVLSFSMQKGFGYIKFAGITSIEQAETLKEHDLWIKKEELPDLEEGHFYYFQLMDCKVYNTQRETLGTVTDILQTGAQPVLRIENGEDSFLCPYAPVFIKEVDIEQKEIVIEEMEGLR